MKKAAHFLLVPELAYSPPNEAVVSALLELGFQVDLYAPGAVFPIEHYGPRVTANHVEYSKLWIIKNLANQKWRNYNLFSGTSEDPMAIVGLLSMFYHRPSFTLADEIRSGSYIGNRPTWWKELCKKGMKHSKFTIVNDEARISLQREYSGQSHDHLIMVYPGCFRNPPLAKDRNKLRESRNIPSDGLVLGYSGVYCLVNGGLWLAEVLAKVPKIYVYGQLIGVDPLTKGLLKKLQGTERLILEENRLSWREAWSSIIVADIGMVVYLHNSPQFQNMGISSNRLCMFLAMGIPVIANRQPSFEFIEQYECGVLVENENEFIDAIGYIENKIPVMKKNALECTKKYISAPKRYMQLQDLLSQLQY